MQTDYQLTAGPAGTEPRVTNWSRQSAYCVPATWDAEVEPSTVTYPPIPYNGRRVSEPSGGSPSETSADADKNQQLTEEHKVPVSNFYRLIFLMQLMVVRRQKVKRTRATTAGTRPRKIQNEIDEMSPRLFAWFRTHNSGRDPADFNEALSGTYLPPSAETRSLTRLVLSQRRSTLC